MNKTPVTGFNECFLDVLDSIDGSIYWKDKNGVYLGCNKYAASMIGLKEPKDVIGKTDYDLFLKIEADVFREHDLLVMETGRKLVIEEKVKSPTGEYLVQLSCKRPLCDKNGKVFGIIANTIDITSRKKIEELQVKHEVAEKTANFANAMAGSIAHELNNPLFSIGLGINALASSIVSEKLPKTRSDHYKKHFCSIKKTISNASYTINDFLTKIKTFASGKVKSVLKEASINEDIKDLFSTYPFEQNEKELVKLKNFNRLNEFKYLGDSSLTKNVFSNLIKNSLRAIKEAGDKGAITIELKKNAESKFNYVIFRDTATGIPKEYITKIFDQFESSKMGGSGTGLGLSFCKMVMQSYNGDIACDSVEGKYSEFILKFPRIGKL